MSLPACLVHTLDRQGIAIALLRDGQPLPVAHWLTTPWPNDDIQAAAETALHLAASGEAEERATEICLSHDIIARLDPSIARRLQLPPPSPYRTLVEHEGILPDANFALRVRFLDDDERTLIGVQRQGTVLTVGDRRFLLNDPIFSAIEAIDRFNQQPPAQRSERLSFLASLHELLAPPVRGRLDNYLSGFRVHRATAVALLLHANRGGELNLEPLLLRPRAPSPSEEESTTTGATVPDLVMALPPQEHRAFIRQLHQRSEVLDRYVLGNGAYLLLTNPLREVLKALRRLKSLPADQRLSALKNPRGYLRQALAEISDETFDNVVVDCESLSERVSHFGQWLGVAVPPTPRSGVHWVPDHVPLILAGHTIIISLQQLPKLLDDLRQAQQHGLSHIEINGSALPVSEEVIAAVERILAFFDLDVTPARPATVAAPARATHVLHVLDNIQWEAFRAQLRPRAPVDLPPTITTLPLLPHQREGLLWLAGSWKAGWPGVILADDMGLGKTLQALAFIAAVQDQARHMGGVALALVVAPTGLLANWRAEAARHGLLPHLGEPLDIGSMRAATVANLQDAMRHASWVLVSYERLRDYLLAFAPIPWTVVVFDEAQRMKNPAARLTNAAKALKGEFVIALTATPVENTLADLWCIADGVCPGVVGSLAAFLRWCEQPDQLARLPEVLFRPRDSVPPFMVRRLKADSLPGLPPKHHIVSRRPMPDLQAAAYTQAHEETRTVAGRAGILAAIQRFRMVSLDPLPRDWRGNDKEYVASSARLSALIEMLDEIAERGEKALIFVDALHVQARLLGLLQRRYALPRPPLVINGQVPGRDRLARVELFQRAEGFNAMLLSPRAGGVGLNLVAANHVIHLARWWNPAVEDQCTDRAFRIGQERAVFVHYPLAIHPGLGGASFDARLEELLSRKRELAARAMTPVAPTVEELAELIR